MLLVPLILVAAGSAPLPLTTFGWHLPASASLETFQGSARGIPVADSTTPAQCDPKDFREVRSTVGIPATDYRIEAVWCREHGVLGNAAGKGPLTMRIVQAGSGSVWEMKETSNVAQIGFAHLPKTWEEDEGYRIARPGAAPPPYFKPQPLLGSLGVPGFVVVQYLSQLHARRGGEIWEFTQQLLDLRGAEPLRLAQGAWFRMLDVPTERTDGWADGSSYSCTWDRVRSDFRCTVKVRGFKRQFLWLSVEKPPARTR